MIAPGSVIGMLGGGQLGRMSILAGRRLGYGFVVLDPVAGGPASMVADREINAGFDDEAALDRLAALSDVITLEFENIPAAAVERLQKKCAVHPGQQALFICQNRRREKNFLREHGFPCADFAVVSSVEELSAARERLGHPCVLKTADFGYDGKGQRKLTEQDDSAEVWQTMGAPVAVVEQWIAFMGEFSAICARNEAGEEEVFPVAENIHRNHILHTTMVPARLTPDESAAAEELARELARALGVVGLLAVELFLTESGWVVNEMAPRPHNSGHYTFDACLTSQFEQHIRAVAGLPLGAPDLLRPVVMVNLLGDVWDNGEPDWSHILSNPRAKLHLYGKREARRGRKMGHFCVLADTVDVALAEAKAIEAKLLGH